MEKLNHAPRPEVPKPMPRTMFMPQSSDSTAERPTTAGATAMSRQDSKEGKHKGAYSKIKGLFPKTKVKYAEDKCGSDNVNVNSYRGTQEPLNRPKPSKNKYKQSRSLEENAREKLCNENDSRPFSNGNHQVRPPGLNILALPSTQPKIRNQEQLVEISQRAMESIQEARCASDNAQHKEAAKKYQKSLDFIDAVLETPLGNLRLSPVERNKVEQIVVEMKLLRKDALQGFSDAQCAYSLPSGMMDVPTGAPPSYNDVLNEDLLINTQEVLAGVPPLLPVLASSSSKTPCLSGTQSARTSHSWRERSKPRNHNAVPDDITNTHFPARPKIIPNIRQTPKPVFPADVNVKDKKQIKINSSRINKISVADATSLSDESFASAVSSLSPEKDNGFSKSICDENQQTNFIADPFAFEDPFADYQCENEIADQSIFSPSNETDLSPRKELTYEVSFLHDTNYHTEVISNETTNPFKNSSFACTADKPRGKSANTSRTTNNLCESASTNRKGHADPFAALQMEARKQFAGNCPTPNAAAVEVPSVASDTNTVEPKNVLKCVTSFSADDSMLNADVSQVLPSDSYNRETFEKRRRLTKSVINLNDRNNANKVRGTHFALSRMKTFSRSNESILRMFDPIITDEKSYTQKEKESEKFAATCLLSGAGRYNPANDIQFGIKIAEVDDSVAFVPSERNERPNKSSAPTDDSSKTTASPQPNESSFTIELERPRSLYPTLSVDEDTLIERQLPPVPAFSPTSGDVGASTAPTSRGKSQITKPVASSVTAGRVESDMHAKNCGKATKHKKTRHLKEKIVTFRDARTENEKPRGDAKLTHGMSAFYQPSEVPTDSADAPVAPQAPPRSSSQRPPQQWQEILQLSDAVKLFFLGDAGVSSPFNRQSLLLLRKLGGPELTGDLARIEVGGELFAQDLDDRKTLIMLDECDDYIIQSATGAFMCMALCSKVKRHHVLSLEKTFDIYATFAKESQMTKLPGSESVSGYAKTKKHAQEKAPSVSRTTKFVKRNSMRALRKLKGVIVGDVTEPQQELRPEFLPLREAADKFRTARDTKTVRYF